jgi:hypothetical protein
MLGTDRAGGLPTADLAGRSGRRRLRAVEALELNGGQEARAALERLAKGQPADRLTTEARASLARLAERAATKP